MAYESVGGEYNATLPTVPDGKERTIQIDAKGRIITSPGAGGTNYETVAASQTAQAMGATGAAGDYLSHVVFQPSAVGAGTSTVSDNATVLFTYTAGTLTDLRPIYFVAGGNSTSGAWKVTTGANMTAVAFGNFT